MPNVPEFKRGDLIESHPAWDIYRANPTMHLGLDLKRPVFRDEEIVGLPFETRLYGTMYHWFRFGSVISYALKHDEDPLNSYRQTLERGQKTHWLNPCATILSDTPTAKESRVACDWAEEIIFEGRLFTIEKDFNNNAKLLPA